MRSFQINQIKMGSYLSNGSLSQCDGSAYRQRNGDSRKRQTACEDRCQHLNLRGLASITMRQHISVGVMGNLFLPRVVWIFLISFVGCTKLSIKKNQPTIDLILGPTCSCLGRTNPNNFTDLIGISTYTAPLSLSC